MRECGVSCRIILPPPELSTATWQLGEARVVVVEVLPGWLGCLSGRRTALRGRTAPFTAASPPSPLVFRVNHSLASFHPVEKLQRAVNELAEGSE